MSDGAPCAAPTPAPEHAFLLESVGTWNVKTKHFMEPGSPPIEGTATDKVVAIGGFWTSSRYETLFMGQPFIGQCTLGYDPEKKRYVMTWVDSMSHFLFIMEGLYDAKTKTMSLTGKGPSMTGPGLVDWRCVMHVPDKNHQLMKMYVAMPMGECQLMENAYTRKL